MKNITKLLVAVALVLSVVYGVNAARSFSVWNVAVDQNSNALSHPGFEGKSFANFASTTESAVCTGKCLIYDIIMSTGAGDLTVYDSTTTTLPTGHAIFASFGFTASPVAMSAASGGFPIVTHHGIAVDLSSVAGGEEVLIVYKDLD